VSVALSEVRQANIEEEVQGIEACFLIPIGETARNLPRYWPRFLLRGELIMNREQVKGATDKALGTIKDMVGKVTGSKKMQAEGNADKAAGVAQSATGQVKESARTAADKVKHP
jgi:uncharacterized protein YjbJ (UPF0337 family)